MKPITTLAATSLAFIATLSMAQLPPGVTMDMINTTLPEEGAPRAEPGPYAVTSGPAFGNDGLVVFRPADLAAFPKRDTLPVVIWGNGGCALNVGRAAGFLETIASHGFLVISTAAGPQAAAPPAGAAQPGAVRRSATAQDLAAGISWMQAESQRAGSPLADKIATRQVAVMGQSCGGKLAIELGADSRVGTIGVFNSGAQPGEYDQLAKLHGPVLFINGGERDFTMAMSKASFEAIDKLPEFYGSRHGAGHTATMNHPGGGEWANVAWNWVMWQFKADRKSAAMFVGKKCGLCTNANWDVEQRRLGK